MKELGFILRQTMFPRMSEKCLHEVSSSNMYCLQSSEVNQEKMTFSASVVAVVLGVITSLVCVHFLVASMASLSFVSIVCITGLALGLISCLYPVYILAVQAFSRTTKFIQNSNALKQEFAVFKRDFASFRRGHDNTKICLLVESAECFNLDKTLQKLSYVRVAIAAVGIVIGTGLLIAGMSISTAYTMYLGCNNIVVMSFIFSALGVACISSGFTAFKVHMLSSEALGWLQLLILGSCLLSESKTKDSLENQLEDVSNKLSDMMLINSKQRTQIEFLKGQIKNMSFGDAVKQQMEALQLSSLQKFRRMISQGTHSVSELLSFFMSSLNSHKGVKRSNSTMAVLAQEISKDQMFAETSSYDDGTASDEVIDENDFKPSLESETLEDPSDDEEEYFSCG